jgi:hypothetical protein
MARVRTLCTISRGGVFHPPRTELDGFEPSEIKALRGYVEEIPDVAAADPAADGDAGPSPDPVPAVTGPANGAEGSGEDGGRVAEIARALDVLDEGDFDADGAPKLGPLADVLGYAPEPDEIAAAVALRAEMT